ncbi:MAG TPA: helix-hairpin-helix domain-containing protein [Bryobacteraceae bacterium]|nr:helix-hairpin-helix domain-containing protein [Bryobacteraceae bacterium]
MCGGACHELDVVTSERLSKQGWANTVDTMISRGATGTDEEIAAAIDYLAEHFGREPRATSASAPKIYINTETATELATDLAISTEEADAIVRYREKEGKFKTWDDLRKVPRFDMGKIEGKKNRVVF